MILALGSASTERLTQESKLWLLYCYIFADLGSCSYTCSVAVSFALGSATTKRLTQESKLWLLYCYMCTDLGSCSYSWAGRCKYKKLTSSCSFTLLLCCPYSRSTVPPWYACVLINTSKLYSSFLQWSGVIQTGSDSIYHLMRLVLCTCSTSSNDSFGQSFLAVAES